MSLLRPKPADPKTTPSRSNWPVRFGVATAALAACVLTPAAPAAAATCVPTGSFVTVPDVVDFGSVVAAQILIDHNLVPTFSGTGRFVFLQSPGGGAVVPDCSVISMTLRPIRG